MARCVEAKPKLTWRTRISYGVGHILNDLCASMWFTYLLVYLHKVVEFSNVAAGTLLLIGQVADALATPFVGVESDKTGDCKYGRRKVWHLVGVLCVACSFPFVFNLCIHCENASTWALFMYYVPFIVIFQFGWASTQISHLSLIPELTDSENEKVTLNAIRYAGTVSSNIFVFLVTWVLITTEGKGSAKLAPSDSTAFMYVVFIVVGTGLLFMLIFHVGLKEPPRACTYALACEGSKRSAGNWIHWFKEIQFYQVALLYMCTRLIVNITQVYIPMYTLETLSLSKDTIAKIPLVIYVSGFLSTFLTKPLNKCYGRKGTFFLGLLMIGGVSLWMWFIDKNNYTATYGAAALLGVGGSTLLVTALTMLADLIGENVETGAFVYGAMSFTDKLSNGIAVQLIQIFHPCNKLGEHGGLHSSWSGNATASLEGDGHVHPHMACCPACHLFYREVMVFVAGGATILAFFVLLTMVKTNIGEFEDSGVSDPNVQDKLLGQTTSVSASRSIGSTTTPCLMYEPKTPPKYGAMNSESPCSIQEDFTNSYRKPEKRCER
ncbi:hypothetical protein ACROYT_G001578 [Oculina patagonica]